MFRVEPNTLYSLDDLKKSLGGLVGLRTFLHRLGLRDRRVFRDAVWGFELLEAAREARPFAEGARHASSGSRRVRSGRAGGGRLSVNDL